MDPTPLIFTIVIAVMIVLLLAGVTQSRRGRGRINNSTTQVAPRASLKRSLIRRNQRNTPISSISISTLLPHLLITSPTITLTLPHLSITHHHPRHPHLCITVDNGPDVYRVVILPALPEIC